MSKSLSDSPYINPPQNMTELVEIFDAFGHPLLLCPLAAARRHKFPRRTVLVCLRDRRGRIFLQRRALHLPVHPGLWDMAVSGDVLAGESYAGAALRELEQRLGLKGLKITPRASLPYTDSNGASLSAMFFMAGPVSSALTPDPASICDSMYVDLDELNGLIRYQHDMLTPELIWAVRSGWMTAGIRQ